MDVITCESCGKTLQVPPSAYGQMVQCPMCKHTFEARPSGGVQAPPALPPRTDERRYDEPPPRPGDRWERDRDDYAGRPVAPHRGATILVLGILGILMCGPFTSIPAWVMGNTDLKEITAGRMDRSGEGMTRAGQILGIVGTILSILGICIWGLIIIMAGAAGGLR